MEITIKTKYDIGQNLFGIYVDYVNNDFYCTDTKWYVQTRPRLYIDDPIQAYRLDKIIVELNDFDNINVKYVIDNNEFEDKDIFVNYEEACNECIKRNK